MIFVPGDCHGNIERFKPEYFPEQAQMTKRDIVICEMCIRDSAMIPSAHNDTPVRSFERSSEG